MFDLSIGIMAYNEEQNIGRLLPSLLRQDLSHGFLKEIIVVASGCTDRTEDIVRDFMKRDRRIKLLVQAQREGKASAINLFLPKASSKILVLESGDTIPDDGALDALVAPFSDSCIGMTGAHPIPVNPKDTFIGFTVNLMWSLHHRVSLMTPKMGELVAFRNFVSEIPLYTAVDEANIEAIVRENGYELHYVPNAIVYNKGPDNIKDFLTQRRRIAAGHKHLLRERKYRVSTMSPFKILSVLLKEHSWTFRDTIWTLAAIGLEVIGRILGYYDFFIRKRNPFIWDIATSTKKWT